MHFKRIVELKLQVKLQVQWNLYLVLQINGPGNKEISNHYHLDFSIYHLNIFTLVYGYGYLIKNWLASHNIPNKH
jgi:hypothetical protein